MSLPEPLLDRAPAKINLTLHVRARRADGYHELESLVVFANLSDTLRLWPGEALALKIAGPTAAAAGTGDDNLVVRAARALAARVAGLRLGRFLLDKQLPVAAGIGGGSADAAAALRLLARANALAPDDAGLIAAARATGADVPVCLDPRARIMRGIGEILSAPLALQPLPAVLVNPGVPVATAAVFAGLALPLGGTGSPHEPVTIAPDQIFKWLAQRRNDLEPPAIAIAPVIAEVLTDLRGQAGCQLARMSGSGATCFGLFASEPAAARAAKTLSAARPGWWVRAVTLQ